MTRPSPLVASEQAALALLRADRRARRAELEHLMGDATAEILLLEVERRRIERSLRDAAARCLSFPERRLLADRWAENDAKLVEMRQMTARIRAALDQAR